MLRGSSASGSSTPRRSTAPGWPRSGSARRCPRGRGTSTRSRRRSGACCDPDGRAGTSSERGHSSRCSTTAETAFAARSPRASSGLQLERVDIALLHDPDDTSTRRAARSTPCASSHRTSASAPTTSRPRSRSSRPARSMSSSSPGATHCSTARPNASCCPLCAERGLPVIAAGVFNSGVLAGGATFDYESAPADILKRRDALEAACARYAVPLAAAAIQFPLRHPAVESILVGARSPAEIRADAATPRRCRSGRALVGARRVVLIRDLRSGLVVDQGFANDLDHVTETGAEIASRIAPTTSSIQSRWPAPTTARGRSSRAFAP